MHRRCTGHKQSMDDNFEKTLERLKTDYIESSSDTLDKIDAIIERMHSGAGDKGADFVDLQRDIHSLKGSAGTFGFSSVTIVAHRLEDYIEATRRLSNEQLMDVQVFIDGIRGKFQADVNPTEAEMDAIARITRAGLTALSAGNVEAVGMAMDACHQTLRLLGVSSPSLEALVEAVGPHALGAKLTGAGGGGCMIALAREPQRVAEAIEVAGGMPLISRLGASGVRLL